MCCGEAKSPSGVRDRVIFVDRSTGGGGGLRRCDTEDKAVWDVLAVGVPARLLTWLLRGDRGADFVKRG